MKSEALVALASLLCDVRTSLRTLESQVDRAIEVLVGIAGSPIETGTRPNHGLALDETRFTVRWDGRECELGQRLNEHRPHQGLGQRTPAEVHHATSTRASSVLLRAVLAAEPLDGNRHLPVLRLRAVA